MRRELDSVPIDGTIVIGEGERDEAPMLFIGEKVGVANVVTGRRGLGAPLIDIAVDPLEGTNLCATGAPGAIAVLAASERGGLLHAPDLYMEKLIVPSPCRTSVDLDAPVADNLRAIASDAEPRRRRPGDHGARSTASRAADCRHPRHRRAHQADRRRRPLRRHRGGRGRHRRARGDGHRRGAGGRADRGRDALSERRNLRSTRGPFRRRTKRAAAPWASRIFEARLPVGRSGAWHAPHLRSDGCHRGRADEGRALLPATARARRRSSCRASRDRSASSTRSTSLRPTTRRYAFRHDLCRRYGRRRTARGRRRTPARALATQSHRAHRRGLHRLRRLHARDAVSADLHPADGCARRGRDRGLDRAVARRDPRHDRGARATLGSICRSFRT